MHKTNSNPSRRAWLKRLLGAAAVVALAPQLAFRVKPLVPGITCPSLLALDTEYRCILQKPDVTHTLVSTTIAGIWADPNQHVTIENFSE